MTIEELRDIMHQLKLDFDSTPQLVYVFYQTPDGLVNNFSINIQHARQRNRKPMTDQQLADLMQRQYPASRGSRLMAVERPDSLSRWLDSAEVCQKLNTTRQTISRWARRGLLHPSRIGRYNYYDAAEVEALLRSNIIQDNGRLDQTGTIPDENTF
ncbi:MAG: helix-turn-helix domain-containing protein [Bacteroidales bacterium]|nr:helix-turn-helix domain-containing protein [Bacteroidales bacterium]